MVSPSPAQGNMARRRARPTESFRHEDDMDLSKTSSNAGQLAASILSQWLAALAMLSLIFGGCCSNVYALESIIQVEPASGMLLTFVQFLFVAVTGYVSQFDSSRPPFFVQKNTVPLRRWLVNIVLFFAINVLNNHAFSYDISVPVHIILRSGGSITTIVAGYLYGKRYSRVQVVAVLLLTIGVITAAWSDATSKDTATTSPTAGRPSFSAGLAILLVAQILSAVMGLYTEETYKVYGPQWRENLFYSHVLSLPLFLPFAQPLVLQFRKLMQSSTFIWPSWVVLPWFGSSTLQPTLPLTLHVPSQLVYLMANVLTQYACIRGVNLLAAASSALTVTIVLNIRKLISLLLSIWLFGNRLSSGTLIGAIIVFSAGALYSLDSKSKCKHSRGVQASPDSTTIDKKQ